MAHREIAHGCAVTAGVVAAAFAILAGGCAVVISGLNNIDFDFSIGPVGRTHLAPIPVSQEVCPYVEVMHAAANNFERVYRTVNPLHALAAMPTGVVRSSVPWPTERRRLAQSINVLEFAVVASKAQFPGPIEQKFDIVLTSIREGRTQLGQATDAMDVLNRSSESYGTGHYAFGDASDLIGNACAVHLAADS